MRAVVATTLLIVTSACSLERGTSPVPQPQRSALSQCYAERCVKPMFVVDGKRLVDDSVDLNPTDIDTVEVFKGEKAVEAYGEAARNGVVVITTKRAPSKGSD